MHYKVFLDTNIYDATNYSFRNDLFMQMRNYAESGMLEMQICSVVKNEVCRHIKKKIKGTVKNLNQILSSRDLQLFRTLSEYEYKMETASPSEWVDRALYEFDCLLKDCNAEEITVNGIDVEGVLDDYFEMRYPFETAKKEEFPDAIITRAIEQEIRRLSRDNILVEHKTSDGLVDDMLYCIVSDDNGFMTAMRQTVGERPSEDVKYFSSLNELINFFAVQDKQAAELQEKLNNGYARELIETTIEEGVSSAAFTVDEPDGYVEDTSNMGTGDYLYDAFVISLQEMVVPVLEFQFLRSSTKHSKSRRRRKPSSRRSRMKTASFPTSRSAPKSSSTPLELITVKLSRNRRKWLASRSVATPWRSRCSRCR